jgi:hypothetical protein
MEINFKIAGYVDLAVLIIFTPCQISGFINGFWVITQKLQFYPYVLFKDMAAMMVGRQDHRTYLLTGTP